jgi:hypothetical protein
MDGWMDRIIINLVKTRSVYQILNELN